MTSGLVQVVDDRFRRVSPIAWEPIVVCGTLGAGKTTELIRLAQEACIPILYGVTGQKHSDDVPQVYFQDLQPGQWVIVDDIWGYAEARKRRAKIYAISIGASEVRITDRPADGQFRRTTFPLR